MGLGIAKPKETGWQKKTDGRCLGPRGKPYRMGVRPKGLTECRRPKGLLYLILYSFASLSHNLKGFIHYSLRS